MTQVERQGDRRVIRFAHCEYHLWDTMHYAETRFHLGHTATALFEYSDEDICRALSLGYANAAPAFSGLPIGVVPQGREPALLMHIEHDIAHSFLAELRGFDVSPTLYAVATRSPYLQAWEEEAIVLGFQRYVNTGDLSGAAEVLRAHKTFEIKAEWVKFRNLVARVLTI